MSEVVTKRTVPVTIQGREYRIRADADGELVRRAAELLDATIDRVRARAGTVDSVDVAVLAGLNIANSLVAQREQLGPLEGFSRRVDALIDVLEPLLAERAPAP